MARGSRGAAARARAQPLALGLLLLAMAGARVAAEQSAAVYEVSGGSGSVCVRVHTPDVRCWGLNREGQLGAGHVANVGWREGQMGENLTSAVFGAHRWPSRMFTGGGARNQHQCVTTFYSKHKTVDDGDDGDAGSADDNAATNGTRLIMRRNMAGPVAAPQNRTNKDRVVDEFNETKCWGENTYGQLGLGDTRNRGIEEIEMGNELPAVQLGSADWDDDDVNDNVKGKDDYVAMSGACGGRHTCAILDVDRTWSGTGKVKCWGGNNFGQLGYGDTDTRGDEEDEMGNALDFVSLGNGAQAAQIVAGEFFTCARLDDDHAGVKCWGDNSFGQLGQGSTEEIGDESGEMGSHLPTINLGTGRTAVRLSAGSFHVCAILDDGTLKCWGWNEYGQLGLGDQRPRGETPDSMGDNLTAVDLGAPAGVDVIDVACGGKHTCALLSNGDVKCFGNNIEGQLGIESTQALVGVNPDNMGHNLSAVRIGTSHIATALQAGDEFTCALLNDSLVKCWGDGQYGQLGQGSRDNIGSAAGDMGNALPVVLDGPEGQLNVQQFELDDDNDDDDSSDTDDDHVHHEHNELSTSLVIGMVFTGFALFLVVLFARRYGRWKRTGSVVFAMGCFDAFTDAWAQSPGDADAAAATVLHTGKVELHKRHFRGGDDYYLDSEDDDDDDGSGGGCGCGEERTTEGNGHDHMRDDSATHLLRHRYDDRNTSTHTATEEVDSEGDNEHTAFIGHNGPRQQDAV